METLNQLTPFRRHASLIIAALVMCLAIPGTAASEIQDLLDSKPVSLDAEASQHEGKQPFFAVPFNLEKLYGVGCVVENARVDGGSSAKYVPFKLTANTTVREFLDHACSDGTLNWGIVAGAVHLWPNEAGPAEPEYLDDVKVSLNLEGASVLEALKAWALEVNRNRPLYGHGVRVYNHAAREKLNRPADATGYHATPASLTRGGAVTLAVEGVTAREALCAIQSHAREWVRLRYTHVEGLPNVVMVRASRAEVRVAPEVTWEERQRLNEEEGLDEVLVQPLAARQESQGAG
jgi:hypothetical protein